MYYLEQVCKVYGTVTVAGTDPATPLGSVEVFVGDYQYSELTNYYGDYEMEMAEGTWTINFRKEGYEPVTAEVTLGPENENQRVQLDVSMSLDTASDPNQPDGHLGLVLDADRWVGDRSSYAWHQANRLDPGYRSS